MTRTRIAVSAVLLTACLATSSRAAEWGDLTATFLFDGAVPKPVPANITKDQAFCGKHKLVDESLVVNPQNKGVANVVVYVMLGRGEKLPVHDSYAELAKADVRLDNENCRYEPHVAVLRTGQNLVIGNKDPVGHNTKIDTFANPPINPIIPAGGELKQQFSAEERLPVQATCSIHPWMTAWVVVKEHPYVAISDEDGKLEIKNLPVGKWTLQVWHEKAGYVSEVSQNGKSESWRRGRVEVEIKPGSNELGEIKLAPAVFK